MTAALSSGCASESGTSNPVSVKVERLRDLKMFKVKWTLASPTRGLVFTRPGQFRKTWSLVGDGLKIESRAGHDTIQSSSPRQEFEALIPERGVDLWGDYPLFTMYSDGGVVLYSGHLQVVPLICMPNCSDAEYQAQAGSSITHSFEYVPGRGERVVIDAGGGAVGVKQNHVPPLEGAMVYFGRQEAVKYKSFTIIPDRGMPAWLLPEIEEALPEILDLNARRLGGRRPAKPLVFFPYRDSSRRYSHAHSGSVVGSQMMLSLFGARWSRRTPEAREDFLKLVAHESFHLWNASMFHSVDRPGGRWLHEGSADAFAYLTLRELGVISDQRFVSMQTEALNRCMVGLSGTDLPSSEKAWSIRNHYDCGAVIQEILHHALRRKGSNLWKFWSQLFDRAGDDRFYTHEDFFNLAGELTGHSKMVSQLNELTSGAVRGGEGQNELERFFFSAFSAVGTVLAASDLNWPQWYHRLVAERALAATIESDCNGEGYFVATGDSRVKLVGGSWCRNLQEEREIDEVGNFELWSEGVQAYEFIREICSYSNAVTIAKDQKGQNVRLMCPRLPIRPKFARFPWYAG